MDAVSADGVGLRSERGPILLALMLSIALVALDSTIIATAVPSIVGSLSGFSAFPWLFSIYLLAQAVTVPVYSKLADIFGRKPLILLGVALFLAGSVLCGLAWSMPTLIAFRVLQGLGAGAVQPIAMTIVGDLYSIEERAKVQGYLASVWGASSVIGPALGGIFCEYLSWRWIFLVNIPLCLLAGVVLWRNFAESVERREHHIDYLGAICLTSGCGLLILGLLEGGEAWSWSSVPGVAVPLAGVVLLCCFAAVETRAPEPMLPLWVFSRRLLLTTSLASAGVGAVVLGLSSYIPTFVQDVLGTGPVLAGFAVATLTLGWPASASQSGRLYLRIGFKRCGLIGGALVVAGTALLILLDESSSVLQVGLTCFLIGLGLGLIATPTLIAAQSTVGWGERGVVTGTNMFCRSVGSALGVALFGAIANSTLGSDGKHSRGSLTTATQHVFLGVLVVSVLMVAAVLCMPHESPREGSAAGVTPADDAPAATPN